MVRLSELASLHLDGALRQDRADSAHSSEHRRENGAHYSYRDRKLDDGLTFVLDNNAPHVALMDEMFDLLLKMLSLDLHLIPAYQHLFGCVWSGWSWCHRYFPFD